MDPGNLFDVPISYVPGTFALQCKNKCIAKMKPLISFRIFGGKYLLEISKEIPKTFARLKI